MIVAKQKSKMLGALSVVLALGACGEGSAIGKRSFTATFEGFPKGTSCDVIGSAGTVKVGKSIIGRSPAVTIISAPETGLIQCQTPAGKTYQTDINTKLMRSNVSFANLYIRPTGKVFGAVTRDRREYTLNTTTTFKEL